MVNLFLSLYSSIYDYFWSGQMQNHFDSPTPACTFWMQKRRLHVLKAKGVACKDVFASFEGKHIFYLFEAQGVFALSYGKGAFTLLESKKTFAPCTSLRLDDIFIVTVENSPTAPGTLGNYQPLNWSRLAEERTGVITTERNHISPFIYNIYWAYHIRVHHSTWYGITWQH